jgi:hypothetical protein
MLFFDVIDSNVTDEWSRTLRRKLVEDSKEGLVGTPDVIWLIAAPAAFSWVYLTGTAASEDSSTRG